MATKVTEYMFKYIKSYYDNADIITWLIWRVRLMFMTDSKIINTYYALTDKGNGR